MKYTKKICLLAGTALLGCALLCGCRSNVEQQPAESVTVPTVSDAKQPSQYTWQEYLAMTEEEKLEFQKKFGSTEVFDDWMDAALLEDTKVECPWDTAGAKQPADYTWEEFEALSGELQLAFQKHLGSEAFDTWLNQVQNQPEEYPWDEPSAKQPEEYTWEEFDALSGEEQMAFQTALGQEAFAAWMDQALMQPAVHPWDEPGAKQPEEYTWEEFEALSGEEQIAFQNFMGFEAFDAWMNQALNQPAANPWDVPGAKQPEEYTWEEFEALSGEEQMAFQNALGVEAFTVWMDQVQMQPAATPWDVPGAKQPEEYTWEEFEALSGEHQIAFQNVLGFEAFDAWLKRVNP